MNINIGINIGSAPANPANYLVIAIYNSTAPTVVVASQALAKPYTVNQNFNVSFSGLTDFIYNVTLWESADTTPSGIARNNYYSLEPTNDTVMLRDNLPIICGTTSGFNANATGYIDNSLITWRFWIERRGTGTLINQTEWTPQLNGTVLSADDDTANGFLLIGSQNPFQTNEIVVIHFYPNIVQSNTTASNAGSLFSSVNIITGNVTLDNTQSGVAQMIQGAGAALTIILPALTSMADNKIIPFFSAGGMHTNAIIQCAGADVINWKIYTGQTSCTSIILAQSEELWLYKNNGFWQVAKSSDAIKTAGAIIYDYTILQLNTIFANGALISRTQYARLWAYVQRLDASCIVADSAWNHTTTVDGVAYYDNHAKYSFGDNSTTFRLPLLYEYGFLRAIGAGNASYFQVLQLLNHQHELTQGTINLYGAGDTRRNRLLYTGSITNGFCDLSSQPENASGEALTTGSENRPSNTGVYALIRI